MHRIVHHFSVNLMFNLKSQGSVHHLKLLLNIYLRDHSRLI